MMSTSSNIDPQAERMKVLRLVELMKLLRQISPDIKFEKENVKARWNEKEYTVRLFLHFKGTYEKYSIN